MNAILSETQLWFCDFCDKTINFNSESKFFKSKAQKHKKNMVSLLQNMKLLNQKVMT